jgi:hypothetical protein
VTEIPVNHRPRYTGETKYDMKRLLKGGLDLLFNAFWNRFSARPLHFLGGIGIAFITLGVVIGTHAVIIKYAFGVSLVPRTPRLILIALLILFGVQLFLFGFIAEMITKVNYKNEKVYRIKDEIE